MMDELYGHIISSHSIHSRNGVSTVHLNMLRVDAARMQRREADHVKNWTCMRESEIEREREGGRKRLSSASAQHVGLDFTEKSSVIIIANYIFYIYGQSEPTD